MPAWGVALVLIAGVVFGFVCGVVTEDHFWRKKERQ